MAIKDTSKYNINNLSLDNKQSGLGSLANGPLDKVKLNPSKLNGTIFSELLSSEVVSAPESQVAADAIAAGATTETEKAYMGNIDAHKQQVSTMQKQSAATQELSRVELLYDKFGQLSPEELASEEGFALVKQYIPTVDKASFVGQVLPKIAQRQNVIKQLSNLVIGQELSPGDRQKMAELGISQPERYMQLRPKKQDVLGDIGSAAVRGLGQAVNAVAQQKIGPGNPFEGLASGLQQQNKLQQLNLAGEIKKEIQAEKPLGDGKIIMVATDQSGKEDPAGAYKSHYRINPDGTKTFLALAGYSDMGRNENLEKRTKENLELNNKLVTERMQKSAQLRDYTNKVQTYRQLEAGEQAKLRAAAIDVEKDTVKLSNDMNALIKTRTQVSKLYDLVDQLDKRGILGAVNGRLTDAIQRLDPSDPLVAEFETAIKILSPDLAANSLGLGRLTDNDIVLAKSVLPMLSGNAVFNKAVLRQLEASLDGAQNKISADIASNKEYTQRFRDAGGSSVKSNVPYVPKPKTIGEVKTVVETRAKSSTGKIDTSRLTPAQLKVYKFATQNPGHKDSARLLSKLLDDQNSVGR
jgi:hypothetical protein